MRDGDREGEGRRKGNKRPRQDVSRQDAAERPRKRTVPQQEVSAAVGQAFMQGQQTGSLGLAPGLRGLRDLASLHGGAAVAQRLRKHALRVSQRGRQADAGTRAGRQQGAAPAGGGDAAKGRAAKGPAKGQQQRRAVRSPCPEAPTPFGNPCQLLDVTRTSCDGRGGVLALQSLPYRFDLL